RLGRAVPHRDHHREPVRLGTGTVREPDAVRARVTVRLGFAVPVGLALCVRDPLEHAALDRQPVVNAGFESGALSPWTCDSGTAAVVSTPAHAGSHALAITPTSSDDAQCSQSVAVKSNTKYTLTAR